MCGSATAIAVGTVAAGALGAGAGIYSANSAAESNKDAANAAAKASIPVVPSWLLPQLQEQASDAGSLANIPYQPYTDPRVAGLNADEQQAQNLARGLAGGADLSQSQVLNQQVADRGLYGYDQATLNQYMNPYTKNVMDVSKQRQLDQYALQNNALKAQQAQIGSFGGSRSALAQGQLYDQFSRQLSENEANQLYQSYNDAQNRAYQGTQMAGQAAGQMGQQSLAGYNTQLQGLQALGASGALSRGLEQQQMDVNYQNFLTEQNDPWAKLQAEQGITGSIAGLTTSGGHTPPQPYSVAAAGLGGAALGASSYNAFKDLAGAFGSPSSYPTPTQVLPSEGSWQGSNFIMNKEGGLVGYADGGAVDQPTSQPQSLGDKVDGFYALLQKSMDFSDDERPAPQVRTLQQRYREESKPLQGLACGGRVRGYDDGGIVLSDDPTVREWQLAQQALEEANRRNSVGGPIDGPPINIPKGMRSGGLVQHYEDGGMTDYLSSLWNKYQTTGGLAGTAVSILDPVDRVLSTPDASGQTAYTAGSNLMQEASDSIQRVKDLEYAKAVNNSVTTPKDDMLRAGSNAWLATAKGTANVLGAPGSLVNWWNEPTYNGTFPAQAGLARDKALIDKAMQDGTWKKNHPVHKEASKIFTQITGKEDPSMQMPAPEKKRNFMDIEGWNQPLLAFGAAMLSGKGSFGDVLGQGVTAAQGNIQGRKAQEAAAAEKAADREIKKYNAETGRLNTMSTPFEDALKQAQADYYRHRAQGNGNADALKLTIEQIKANPMLDEKSADAMVTIAKRMASQLSGSGTDDIEAGLNPWDLADRERDRRRAAATQNISE